MTEANKPKHGERRNIGVHKEYTTQTFNIAGGELIKIRYASQELCSSEIWCDCCQKWVTCVGLISHVLCPSCQTAWQGEL